MDLLFAVELDIGVSDWIRIPHKGDEIAYRTGVTVTHRLAFVREIRDDGAFADIGIQAPLCLKDTVIRKQREQVVEAAAGIALRENGQMFLEDMVFRCAGMIVHFLPLGILFRLL